MPRQTRQQIDDEIIDCAATLFARHGLKETSLQRIADAVGYSKSGLLRYYPSKESLQDAVISRLVQEMRAIAGDVAGQPLGPGRDRAAISAVAAHTARLPGFVALMLASLISGPDSDLCAVLEPVGQALLGAFGVRADTTDTGRLVRVTGALGALAVTRIALGEQLGAALGGTFVDVSYDALGHPHPAAQ